MNYKKTVEAIGDKINEYSEGMAEEGLSIDIIEDEAFTDVDKGTNKLLNDIVKEKSKFTDMLIGSTIINDRSYLQLIMTELDSQEISTPNQFLQAFIQEIIRSDVHSATFPLDIQS